MAQFTNPLFAPQIGERSTSGGAEQSSASGESLSAAYRPSPVPLRSIGDVVSSLGKVQAVQVPSTTKPTNHPVLRVRYRKGSGIGDGSVYDSSICLPSGTVIPATTNLLAHNGLQWVNHNPPWHESVTPVAQRTPAAQSIPATPFTPHTPHTPQSETTSSRRRSSSRSVRDRIHSFARSFRNSDSTKGRWSESSGLADDETEDRVRVTCFKRSSGGSAASTPSKVATPSKAFRRDIPGLSRDSRISTLAPSPRALSAPRRVTAPEVSSRPKMSPAPPKPKPPRSTAPSPTTYAVADVRSPASGGDVFPAPGLAVPPLPAAPSKSGRKTRKSQPDKSLQSTATSDMCLDKVASLDNTSRESTSPPQIAAQRSMRDSIGVSTAEQSLHLQSRVPSTSQCCSPGQQSPYDSFSDPMEDAFGDDYNQTQLLQDAYASEMGATTQLLGVAARDGNPTQALLDAYGSDMSFARSGRLPMNRNQPSRLARRNGPTVALRNPREVQSLAIKEGDSCSVQLQDSGALGDSSDGGHVEAQKAQSMGLRHLSSTHSKSAASVPLKKHALNQQQSRRRLEWTQAHASGMWHGRTLADLNQLSKEWQDLKTNISTTRSRTNSPARVLPPHGAQRNSQSTRLSVSRARRRMQSVGLSAALENDSAPQHPEEGCAPSPTKQRSRSLAAQSQRTRSSVAQGGHVTEHRKASGRKAPTTVSSIMANVSRRNRSAVPNGVTSKSQPFVAQNYDGRTSQRSEFKSAQLVYTSGGSEARAGKTKHLKAASGLLGSPQHAPGNVTIGTIQSDDVRYANTATKRIGRDPRPRRSRRSPDGTAASRGPVSNPGLTSSRGPASNPGPISSHARPSSRPAGSGPVSSGRMTSMRVVREPKWLAEHVKPTVQGKKWNAGGSSLTNMRASNLSVNNGAGSLTRSAGVDSSVGRGRSDLPKRAMSRGDKRGVWR